MSVLSPQFVRPRRFSYSTNDNDNRAPGVPTNGRATHITLGDGAWLTWNAPLDQGSSLVTGYYISKTIGSTTTIINTEDPACSYNDTTATTDEFTIYKVAAYNGYGTGSYSAEFYYPSQSIGESGYIVIAQNGKLLSTGDGTLIRISGP